MTRGRCATDCGLRIARRPRLSAKPTRRADCPSASPVGEADEAGGLEQGAFRARRGSGGVSCAAAVLLLLAVLGCDRGTPPPAQTNEAEQPQRLPTATLRVGDLPLTVEVADSEAERQKGMMFRPRIGPDEAMLFVFVSDANIAFWMKNSYVDLDLAFIRSDGSIVQTERMLAYNEELVFSREPVRFALEAPAGWFGAHGIAVGTKVAIPEDVAARATP
jgi:uncharacterized membrane protein (UPF0127 family)